MKALAILLLCAPLLAAEMEGDRIKLSPDEMRQCAEGGGCVVVTATQAKEVRETLMGLLAEVERLQKSCRRLPHDV